MDAPHRLPALSTHAQAALAFLAALPQTRAGAQPSQRLAAVVELLRQVLDVPAVMWVEIDPALMRARRIAAVPAPAWPGVDEAEMLRQAWQAGRPAADSPRPLQCPMGRGTWWWFELPGLQGDGAPSRDHAVVLQCADGVAPGDLPDALSQVGLTLQCVGPALAESVLQHRLTLAEAELHQRFDAILATVPEAVVFIEDDGHRAWINDAGAHLLKLPPDWKSALQVSTAMRALRSRAVNAAELDARGREMFGQQPSQRIDDWLWEFEGPPARVLSVCCVPVHTTVLHARLWVFSDVTAQRAINDELRRVNEALAEQTQLALDQNLAKSQFLSAMSHEIRTPLNAILGLTHLLGGPIDAAQRQLHLQRLSAAGQHLLGLVNDILDLSKIEAGKLTLDETDLDLRAVLLQVESMVTDDARRKGLHLACDVPDAPTWLRGDGRRLVQCLLNLLHNAVKFTDRGTVRLRVQPPAPDTARGPRPLWRFEVSDTGIGIGGDQLDRLFQPFEQVLGEGARPQGGTGLGLAITRRLAVLMGGDAGARSQPGRGSTFWFTAQLHAVAPDPGIRTTDAPRPHDAALRDAYPAPANRSRVDAAPMPDASARNFQENDRMTTRPMPSPTPASSAGACPADAEAAAAPAERLRTAHAGHRVLLVEDNEINQIVATSMLEDAGLAVELAGDGVEALKRLSDPALPWPRLVLMDMQMPRMDGLEATRQLRALSGGDDLPVIAMTANAYDEDRRRCIDAGMDDMVVKPVEPDALYETLLRWMAGRRIATTSS